MCDSCHYSDSSSEESDSNSEHSDSESEDSVEESCSGGSCSRGAKAKSYGRRGNSSGGSKDIASNFCLLDMDCSDGVCARRPKSGSLPFDPKAIQDIILKLSDTFDMRVNMSSSQMKTAVMITSGLALAGSVIGKSFGGNMGAAIGGAVGGACGVGYSLVSLREVWDEVWWKLSELFDITYDFLGGLGFQDYQSALKFLLSDRNKGADLVKILSQVASSVLGTNVIPSLMPQ